MLSLLPLFLLLPSTSSLSCLPTCPTKAVSPSSCPSGEVVLGPCGCPECARAEREVCGGPWNIGGICAAGLACLDTKGKETGWPESQMTGVCRPSCQEASTLGQDYRGTMATTAGGHTCQAWDSSSPHGCGGQPCFPGLKANHCRNPDSEPGGVWCYTTDTRRRWDYCDVPQCPERPVCPQVLCCGSDGTTYPTPCAAPPGVTCVTNTECPKACPHSDSAWTPWSPCSPSTSCRSSRTRDMVTGCGKECRKETITEERRCLSCCPLSPSPWTPWSPCPVACGGGVTRRTRDAVLDIQGDCYRQILEQEDTCNLGPCPATGCPKGCTKIFAPVCGSDGETYANHCELKRASCSSPTHIALEYEGECKEDNCPEFCPEIYRPVCGSDGKTYGNKCFLLMASCTTPITLDYEGKCKKTGCDGGDGCCTPASPCGAGEGDCDADSECLPGLTCGKDNCGGGTFEDDDDCCVDGPLEEQTITWRKGMSPAWLCVTPGTNVTFSWTSGHNLMEVDEASYTSCTGLSPTLPAMGPATWRAPRVPGTHYFTCGVPGHCAKGMKATVEVALDALDCPL